jgi:hypothetical protein
MLGEEFDLVCVPTLVTSTLTLPPFGGGLRAHRRGTEPAPYMHFGADYVHHDFRIQHTAAKENKLLAVLVCPETDTSG